MSPISVDDNPKEAFIEARNYLDYFIKLKEKIVSQKEGFDSYPIPKELMEYIKYEKMKSSLDKSMISINCNIVIHERILEEIALRL